MDDLENERVVRGLGARAELCGCGRSLVLSMGALSLRLDFPAAADLANTLRRALAVFGAERSPASAQGLEADGLAARPGTPEDAN